jgi:hypothetical protein
MMNYIVADVMHTIEKHVVLLDDDDKEEIEDFVEFVLEDKLIKKEQSKKVLVKRLTFG